MKMDLFFGFLFITILGSCNSEKLSIDYFGQIPPDKTPKIFAPQFISLNDRFESRGAFSQDGKIFFFTVPNSNFTSQTIFFSEFINGSWSKPDTATFSKKYNNHEPFFSFDGQKLYFSSDRDNDTLHNRRDLFVVEKHNGIWSEPSKLKSPINSEYVDLFFDQSNKGTIYFTSNRPGGIGQWDIYFAKNNNGLFDKLENIGSPINKIYAWDPCIAPDESYLVFSAGREDGHGQSDIYVSFKKDGQWGEPRNLGNQINTEANEFGPFISPDNKYLFFCRHDGKNGDIYWVDLSIINDYRGGL